MYLIVFDHFIDANIQIMPAIYHMVYLIAYIPCRCHTVTRPMPLKVAMIGKIIVSLNGFITLSPK